MEISHFSQFGDLRPNLKRAQYARLTVLIALAITVILSVVQMSFLGGIYQSGPGAILSMGGVVGLALLVVLVSIGVFIAQAILILQWFHRAAWNSKRIGETLGFKMTLEPGWAVGGWFIPLANYVLPYLVAADIHKAHEAATKAAGGTATFSKGNLLLWWLTWVGAQILPGMIGGIMGVQAGLSGNASGMQDGVLIGAVVGLIAQIIAGLLMYKWITVLEAQEKTFNPAQSPASLPA